MGLSFRRNGGAPGHRHYSFGRRFDLPPSLLGLKHLCEVALRLKICYTNEQDRLNHTEGAWRRMRVQELDPVRQVFHAALQTWPLRSI